MPGVPSQWVVGGNPTDAPVSAGRLNYDMYTYDSNEFHPTGVYYGTYRPLFYEILAPVSGPQTAGSTAAGSRNVISGTSLNTSETLYDTSGAWGAGADTLQGVYQFLPTVPGSDGGGFVGGYYIMCGFLQMFGSNAGSRVLGCDLEYWNGASASLVTTGGHQSMSTTKNNCAFYMDLVPTGPNAQWGPQQAGFAGFGVNSGFTYLDACFISDTSLATYTAVGPTTGDTSGDACRHWDMWASVNNGTGWGSQSAIGSPKASWPQNTAITSAVMQNSLATPLTWLSNPVSFRAASNITGVTLNNSTATQILFPSGTGTTITNANSNWVGGATSTFTVPVAGLYLFHGVVSLTSTAFTGQANAGARINGSTIYWGPSYAGNATTANVIAATKTQIFSLQAGDTVQLMGRQTSGGNIPVATGFNSRFMLQWLGDNGAAIGGPTNIGSPVTTYTVPDPTFRWQAGTPGSVLQNQFQQHLGNDIGFLFNRPYFLGYQTTATSLGTNGAFSGPIPLDTIKGVVHADSGDPWSGWNASIHKWVAPVNGWYMVVSEQTVATTNAPTDLTAGIAATTSGGRTPANTPDTYQHILLSPTPPLPNGATAAGLYYLLAGQSPESVFISARANNQTAAAATSVDMSAPAWSTTHMEVVWVGA